MGGGLSWQLALLPAGMLVVAACAFLGAWLGARRTGPWGVTQERIWEALHAIDEVVRDPDERPDRALLRGRLSRTAVSVNVAECSVVVGSRVTAESHTISRVAGVRLEIELEVPDRGGAFIARTAAPIDDDGDDWRVSERACGALGEPFRSDGEPPGWLLDALDQSGVDALRRIAGSFDPSTRRGWLRVAIELGNGRLRLQGIACETSFEEMFDVARALAGRSPVDAAADPYRIATEAGSRSPPPPMPPQEDRRGLDRIRSAAGAAGVEEVLIVCFWAGMLLGFGAMAITRFARTLDTSVVEVVDDAEDRVLRLELERMTFSFDRPGAKHACPPGSRARKEAWSSVFVCERGRVDTRIGYTISIAGGLGTLGAIALSAYCYRKRRRSPGPPARLPEPSGHRAGLPARS
ncbi:MAG: hypothetical protein HYV09_33630 [Deltaproteobacteria bacterium]|nr:hypothetical protein [Deltaproteobacteria bacterium]